jgi:hypothetical protein
MTMKTFKQFLIAAVTVALILPIAPAPKAEAFHPADFLDNPQGVGNALGAVSTDVAILVKYVGVSPAGGNITVAAGGDISLFTGVAGSGTVDLTTECPVSGALGGIIDVSDAACNTVGEVVDAINASPNWRAVLVDSLRSDNADNTFITAANQSASNAKGVALLRDTTIALNTSIALIPNEMRTDIRPWLNKQGLELNPNPFADSQTYFQYANETFTGTGADTYSVRSVLLSNKPTGPAAASTAASIVGSSTETVTVLFSTPGGGTTVNSTFDFRASPLIGRRGEKLMARLTAGTTYTAAVHSASGVIGTYKKSQ